MFGFPERPRKSTEELVERCECGHIAGLHWNGSDPGYGDCVAWVGKDGSIVQCDCKGFKLEKADYLNNLKKLSSSTSSEAKSIEKPRSNYDLIDMWLHFFDSGLTQQEYEKQYGKLIEPRKPQIYKPVYKPMENTAESFAPVKTEIGAGVILATEVQWWHMQKKDDKGAFSVINDVKGFDKSKVITFREDYMISVGQFFVLNLASGEKLSERLVAIQHLKKEDFVEAPVA